MSDPEFQRLITGLGSARPEGSDSAPGQIQKGENGVWRVNITPGDASYLVGQMVQVYEYLETIPYKDTVSVALMGLQAICAGPISIIKNVVGGELMGAATEELASYLIVDKFHGGSQSAQIETTPEGLATEIKATQLFLDLGLGVGVGVLAGGIKSVGKDPAKPVDFSPNELFASASKPYNGQGMSAAGRAVMKHPEYFGFSSQTELQAVYRTEAQRNALGESFIKEILESGSMTTGAGGRWKEGWVTYTLPDGRAASWTSSGEFIGFRGVQK